MAKNFSIDKEGRTASLCNEIWVFKKDLSTWKSLIPFPVLTATQPQNHKSEILRACCS